MGKQINYYIEYETFLLLSQKALDYGCLILKEDSINRMISESKTISIVSNDCSNYYFYIQEAGKYEVGKLGDIEYIEHGYSASGITLIEASFSKVLVEKKRITRGRLFCISDYYNADGELIKRPDCVTKVYNALARYVKKLAPLSEVEHFVLNPMYEGKKLTTKEYITNNCLAIVEKDDFILG